MAINYGFHVIEKYFLKGRYTGIGATICSVVRVNRDYSFSMKFKEFWVAARLDSHDTVLTALAVVRICIASFIASHKLRLYL